MRYVVKNMCHKNREKQCSIACSGVVVFLYNVAFITWKSTYSWYSRLVVQSDRLWGHDDKIMLVGPILHYSYVLYLFCLKATFVLKNVSGASRQLRIIPLNSPFFKVQAGQWTHHCNSNHSMYLISVHYYRVLPREWGTDCSRHVLFLCRHVHPRLSR